MGNYHAPRPPSEEELVNLRAFRVDVVEGRIYNSAGKEVGYEHPTGYIYHRLWIRGKVKDLKRANIVWWAATGEWPTQLLDHDNRNYLDDRLENLKPATTRENAGNRDKDSGLPTGIQYRPHLPKPYIAQAHIDGKRKHLGCHSTAEEASAAYRAATGGR